MGVAPFVLAWAVWSRRLQFNLVLVIAASIVCGIIAMWFSIWSFARRQEGLRLWCGGLVLVGFGCGIVCFNLAALQALVGLFQLLD